MLSLRRTAAIAGKEFRHLRRDHLSGAMILGIPVVMTLLFGFAINTDVRDLPAAVADQAQTSASRAVVRSIGASGVVRLEARVQDAAALERLLAQGRVAVGVYVPPDFEDRLADGRPVAQVLVDGSDPVVQSAARALGSARIGELLDETGARGMSPALAVRPLYNPERRSPVFIVPGLCGVILTLTMVLFTAVALVRERERGNLELLITTPVGRLELMIGKIVPYVAIGYLQVSLILAIGVWLFDVPVRPEVAYAEQSSAVRPELALAEPSSAVRPELALAEPSSAVRPELAAVWAFLFDFYAGAGAFVVSILSLGLLISTLASTQFQAFQMTFMSFLPQLLLSGFMFPFDGMPRQAQWLAELFPLTHFLRIVRGVVLREADLALMWNDLWPLAVFFVVVMALATLRFQKRLD